MPNLREQLLTVANEYCAATNKRRSYVSTIVLKGGHVLDRIENGSDVTTSTWERAMDYFSDNWPRGAKWPAGVRRPKRED